MLNGTMIENTVVGGPAHDSKQFEHGDVVLEVDGQEAKNANIFQLLIGSDIPGSDVEVKLGKGGPKAIACSHNHVVLRYWLTVIRRLLQGPTVLVRLKRMATSDIQDRRRMFELFSVLKVNSTDFDT
jgi:hypothetical protein